jgi:putative hydrolase of the HAD superfamily
LAGGTACRIFRLKRTFNLIRAVFFDWSNTVARYVPSREELQSHALREFGFSLSSQEITPGIAIADRYLIEESAASPLRLRSPAEQVKFYTHYQQMVLAKIGVSLPNPDAFVKLMNRLNELYKKLAFVLYDDVLPAMKALKERGLILALVTNVDADMKDVCRNLGLSTYLDFIVTSGEVGASKPNPKIFLTALERAAVKASEAAHVGDQYEIDVAGAMGAGIKSILLDRLDLFPEVTDCPRIHSLSEVAQYL